MSSPSDRPYKSRFFNFLNRNAIRLRDRAGVAWRNAAQTSVEWGIQILLYPIYLVVQAGRFAQRQLKQTIRDVPRLIASRRKEDTAQLVGLLPPERVLNALKPTVVRQETPLGNLFPRLDIHLCNPKDPFSSLQEPSVLAVAQASDSPSLTNSFKIQGIVALLDSQRLAVVTEENIVLDILTEEQQKILADRIGLEIANYWYEKRLQQKARRRTPGLMPSFRRTWQNVLPPIRWFWGIMRWEQTSEIAREIDLFGESSLVPLEPTPSQLLPPAILTRLDEKLAFIEEQDLISLTQWLQRSLTQQPSDVFESPTWKIQVLIRAAVDYFFGRIQQLEISTAEHPLTIPGSTSFSKILEAIAQSGSHWLYAIGDRLNDRLPERSANPDSDPFKIQVLIKSALEYYLAQEAATLNLRDAGHSQDTPKALPVPSEPSAKDPWLSWDDLFSSTPEHQELTRPTVTALPPAATPPKGKPKTTPTVQKIAPKPQSNAPVAVNSTPAEEGTTATPAAVKVPFPTSYDLPIESEWPDWVETEATPTGYEKHFLERLLGWFDRIFFWIEESIVKVWHLFRSRKRNRKRGQR